MSLRLNKLILILHTYFFNLVTNVVLNSAGNITAEKSAEVTEQPLKTYAAVPEVWSATYYSIGCGCLFC